MYSCYLIVVQQWRDDAVAEQKKVPDHENPSLLTETIATKIYALEREMKYLINKAKNFKPKVKVTPKGNTTKEEKKEEGEAKKEEEEGKKEEEEGKKEEEEGQEKKGEDDEDGNVEEEEEDGVRTEEEESTTFMPESQGWWFVYITIM
jgi:hypoxia up-regulated 1